MSINDVIANGCLNSSVITMPYIIAEAGVNHEGRMDLAKRLIEEAAEGGADAIKFQTYKADLIASKNSPAYWDRTKEITDSQYALFKKYDKFWKQEFEELKKYCDVIGIEFISTPFDMESAKFLDPLMPVFKISSSDITNKPFIEHICGYKKPIILSVGASSLWETTRAIEWIENYGNPLAIMHCILNYPTERENAALGMILDLRNKFSSCTIGYSDHTLPEDMKALEIATLLGAKILEKHFTFDKNLPGNDHYHAMDKIDLKYFINLIKRDVEYLGAFNKKFLKSETLARDNARRSLVARRQIKIGTEIALDDLTWKRPAYGISPAEIDNVIGKIARLTINEDDIIKWCMLE